MLPEIDYTSRIRKNTETIKSTWFEIGRDLKTVKDTKWYKDKYDSFSGYCEKEFSFSRQTAYKFIAGYETLSSCKHGLQLPLHKILEIRKLPKSEREKVATIVADKTYIETKKLVKDLTDPIDVEPITQKPQITTHTYTKTETVKRFTEDKWLAERIISLYCIATRDDGTTYSGPINLTYEDKLPIKTKIEKGILLENKKPLSIP